MRTSESRSDHHEISMFVNNDYHKLSIWNSAAWEQLGVVKRLKATPFEAQEPWKSWRPEDDTLGTSLTMMRKIIDVPERLHHRHGCSRYNCSFTGGTSNPSWTFDIDFRFLTRRVTIRTFADLVKENPSLPFAIDFCIKEEFYTKSGH